VRDVIFLCLEHRNKKNFIGCVNIQTRKLNILDFSSKLPIYCINWFEEGNLIVDTYSKDFKTDHFYKIPFG
jgi:hypothetical protein